MAAANTGAAKKETETKLVELRVFKEDKSPVTRLDQWKIQFSMSNCTLTATRSRPENFMAPWYNVDHPPRGGVH